MDTTSGDVWSSPNKEHAASAADVKDSRGPATDGALSASGAKDPHLEKMYLEASSNAPPKMQSLLQELHAMGRYPNRYKQPANKMEKDSNSLAQKLTKACGSFTPAVQKYVDAMRSTSTATEHAQHAEALMQQVRELGHLPQESQGKLQEQLLAQQLRKAKAHGLLEAFEDEPQHSRATHRYLERAHRWKRSRTSHNSCAKRKPTAYWKCKCGFLDAEGTATEHNPAAAHMQDESTDDEISGASDYGTLA